VVEVAVQLLLVLLAVLVALVVLVLHHPLLEHL
jgi:hypothetical protein